MFFKIVFQKSDKGYANFKIKADKFLDNLEIIKPINMQ